LDEDKQMHVAAPSFRWEWNLNTVVVLVGFASGLIAWGYTLAELKTGRTTNAANIEIINKRLATVEIEQRLLANHELRLTAVERQAGEAATAMRAVERAIGELASDMRLTREILQRLERSQNGRAPP
jgi:predicted nucleic acid-binding protein